MLVQRKTVYGSNDLNVIYRPCKIEELVGNTINKKIIKTALDENKVPHTQMFTGEAGCGKTTVARIVALGLNCEVKGVSSDPCLECPTCKAILEGDSIDIKEINVGRTGGKAYVNNIVSDLVTAPFNSRFKVIIFDEAHKLTTDAKDLLLKPIEDGYNHVYFIFCTNQPDKLRGKSAKGGHPFLDRCSILNFGRIDSSKIKDLLVNVCEFEGFSFNLKIIDIISEAAEGVPRSALVYLSQISMEGSWDVGVAKRICFSSEIEKDSKVFDLFKALDKGSFKESIIVFEKIHDIPVETLRLSLSSLFVGKLKRAKQVQWAQKYSKILDFLSVPIYEQGKVAEHKWYNCMFKITDVIRSPSRRT